MAKPKIITVEQFKRFAIPVETVKLLKQQGLITHDKYWPSSVKAFDVSTSTLQSPLKSIVYKLAHGQMKIQAVRTRVAPKDRTRVLVHALKYLNIMIQDERVKSTVGNQRVKSLFRELEKQRLITKEDQRIVATHHIDPLTSHATHRINVSTGQQRSDAFTQIGYRLAGHSKDDPVRGSPQGIYASYFDMILRRYRSHSLKVQEFSLIKIQSRTPSTFFNRRRSWGFAVGAIRELDLNQQERLSGGLFIENGFTIERFSHSLSVLGISSLTHGRIYNNKPSLNLGVEASLRSQSHAAYYQASLRYSDSVTDNLPYRTTAIVHLGIPLKKNISVNFNLSRKSIGNVHAHEVSTTIHRYF